MFVNETQMEIEKFKSTRVTNQAVYETAFSIGIDVLNHIAKNLVAQDEPRFEDDGTLTVQAQDELLNFGIDGFNDVLNHALVSGWIDAEVVNEARKELGLDPIA